MHYSTTLCAVFLSVQSTIGSGYLAHRNDIVRRYCEPATPDVSQTDIIAVACNQVETIGFAECSNELTYSMSQSAAKICARYRSLYNGCLVVNNGSETACSDAELGYSMCFNYTMQAYAYCGCYYNDPTNLTNCANAELQNSASSSTFSPPPSVPAPALPISTVSHIAPISIYPTVPTNPTPNTQQPPLAHPGPPHALISTLTPTSLMTIPSPAVPFSTHSTAYTTTLYTACPDTTSTFSTTITTTVDAPDIAAPSRMPDIKASLITQSLSYTGTTTGLSLTTSRMGTAEAVDRVYVDPAPTVSACLAANSAAAPMGTVPATEARASPAETGIAVSGAGGEGGVCVGRLRKRTRVLVVGG
ncbi:hypothetical protein N7G274_006031 [Stereocaulon virgatum]|uniref:Uncharacterized protein n=1 Tax=Stereocaulon virgatum TaxID=373712 RepID=A0ABR4A9I5_9LECA